MTKRILPIRYRYQLVKPQNREGWQINETYWSPATGYGHWYQATDQTFTTRRKAHEWVKSHKCAHSSWSHVTEILEETK